MRRRPSIGIPRTWSRPTPSSSAARLTDSWTSADAYSAHGRPGQARMTGAGQRTLARGGQRRHVRDGAAAGERAGRDRVAEGLTEPLERLALHQVGRAGDDREIDVVAGRQRVAQHRDLEPGRGDECEVARSRLGNRVVEHVGRLVERLQNRSRPECDRRGQRGAQLVVHGRLLGARVVEAPPGLGDQLGCVRERFRARHVEPQRRFGFRHAAHGASIGRVIPELSDAQIEVQALVREFCRREVAPHTAAWDSEHHVPMEALRSLSDLGVLGVTVPEEHGGAGLDHTTLCSWSRSSHAMMRACRSPSPCTRGSTVAPIRSHGTPEQQARRLRLATGEQLGCYALTEPDAGSDTASIRLRAERDGDGWLLRGTKTWITNGGFADAVIVFARTGGAGAGGSARSWPAPARA